MTVPSEIREVIRVGSLGVTEFPFPMRVYDEEHLIVSKEVNGKWVGLDPFTYTVVLSGTGSPQDGYLGGKIVYSGLAVGQRIRIETFVPLTQTLINLGINGGFDARLIEKQFDLLIMGLQQNRDRWTQDLASIISGDYNIETFESMVWQETKTYEVNDIVVVDNSMWIARVGHVSSNWTADLASKKWMPFTNAVIPYRNEISYPVGAGQEYATFSDAIEDLMKRASHTSRTKIRLIAQSPSAWNGGILCVNGDYGNFYLEAEPTIFPNVVATAVNPSKPGDTVSYTYKNKVTLNGGWTGQSEVGLPIPGDGKNNHLILGFNCRMPVLAHTVDMGDQGDSGYYMHWACMGCVLPNCGVIHAGYMGLIARASHAAAHQSVWDYAGCTGIRASHGGILAAQQTKFSWCGSIPDPNADDTVGALDVSRGSLVFARQCWSIGNKLTGFHVRRASTCIIEQSRFQGGYLGGIISNMSNVSMYAAELNKCGADNTGAGYGLWIRSGNVACNGAYFLDNYGTYDIRLGDSSPLSSGALIDLSNTTTRSGMNKIEDVTGAVSYNIINRYGIAFNAAIASPLEGLGIWSSEGASRGWAWPNTSGPGIARASAANDTTQSILVAYNTNGIVGTLQTSGSTFSLTSVSDVRIKTNIEPIDAVLSVDDILASVEIVYYDLLSCVTGLPTGNSDIGAIAQDLYEVAPWLVTMGSPEEVLPGDPDFIPWNINWLGFTPMLVRVAQKHRAWLGDLETRVTALEEI